MLLGIALAVLTSWPLVLHLSSRISPDLGDPVRTAWQVAWVGHAMLHDPLHLFDSNAFYPHPLSLAFSDSLLGYGPAAFFGSGTVAALVRYNLIFLFIWSLCFVGGYLLARELGLRKAGAGAAAAAFAYAPYRVTEAGHFQVISSGGIALALFLLLRGYRRRSRGLLIAGWLVAAWQISLGFTLGLQFAYLLAVLAVLAAVYWLRAGRPALPRALVVITCVGMLVTGAVTVYQARPYLKVADEYPTAKRTIKEVENYSSGPAAWISASSENRVWGGVTAGARAHVHSKNEDVFFAGGLILLLALIGLAAPIYTRRLRIGLLVGVVVCAVLALGLGLTGAGYPYRLLYDYAPGWDGVRVPGRIFTLATLFLALLAGAGAQLLSGKLGELLAGRRARGARSRRRERGRGRAGAGRRSRRCRRCRCLGRFAERRALSTRRPLTRRGRYRARRRRARDRHRRRRRRASRPPARAAAGARGNRAAGSGARPADRRHARPHLAVLLDERLLQDSDRQQHVRHAERR